jgi:hypothetical protein
VEELISPDELQTATYIYRLENRLINMINFQFYYNINKRVSDRDSWLGVRLTSWAVAATGPLARVTFVTSLLALEHIVKLDNFGSRSGY